jgi:hypothetical protein
MSLKHTSRIILFLVVCLFSGTAGAAGNIHFGQLELHPFVSLREIFSDNIYYTSTNEKRDSITETVPGIKMQLPMRMHRFEAEYYAVDRRYHTYRGEATTDHHAKGLLDLKFGSFFSLTASGAFDKGHEPRSSSATGFIEVFRKNSGSASAAYQLTGRSKVQVEYTQTTWNFMTSNFRDRDESVTSGYIYYRFLPKTSAFVEYDHKAVDVTQKGSLLDNSMDTLYFGLTWEMTARSKGTIKGGRTSKDFQDSALTDFTEWSWSVDLNHKFTEETSIILVGGRYVNETNAFGTAYYLTTGLYGEFSHKFMSKTAFLLRGSYGKDTFSNAVPPATIVREDKTNMAGAGLKYFANDWLNLGADYNKHKRTSNIPVNDYVETQYVLSMNMSF